jgi:hypothetical protein
MYSINPITHVLISKIFEEDIREIYSSKEKYIEGILMKYPKYEQLYATCEDYIARFSENCDLEMLNSNLELIRQRLVEMPMSE